MKNPLQMCMNPKVIGGLVGAGGLLFVFAPSVAVAALPLLLLAACPLSMLFMGGMMMGGKVETQPETSGAYYCPMHAEVTSDQPGRCSKCGMALQRNSQASTASSLDLRGQVGELQTEVKQLRDRLAASDNGRRHLTGR